MIRFAAMAALVAVAALAAGCGGSASSSREGATGTLAGTATTTTSHTSTSVNASASFDARYGRLKQQLTRALRQLENGKATASIAGAATLLGSCTDSVTTQLGSRARTPKQQQAVSQLRTACADAAQALAKLRSGDTSAASSLARTTLTELEQANTSSK
jgi:hypothetical protein